MAINELRDHGYPYARVSTAESANGRDVTLTFTAEPGTLAHFGPVEIVGNSSVGEGVIRRQLTYKPGDLYRRSVVQDTQRRLYGMELFQFVNVEALNPEREDPDVRTRVTVAEGKHQRMNFGVGYGTEEKARVDGEYHHVNFLGGARAAGAHARWSSLDRGVRLDFNQPYLFTPHFSLGMEGQQWYTFTPAYQSITTGGKVALTHRTSQQTSWSVSLLSERANSSIANDALNDPTLRNDLIALGLDPTTGHQEGTLNAFGFDFQRSTADNPLDARRGYQLAFHTESAGRFLPGTFNYFALSVDGRHYLPIGDRIVVANRLQVGSIDDRGDDGSNVPFSKKYFLGGATSLRGWGRYEVSPLSGSGLPLGGNSLLALNSELRAALRGQLGGVLFVDAGNVWRRRMAHRPRRGSRGGGSRSAVRDPGRPDPLRLRLSAQPDRRADDQRRRATAALAHSLQHRPGVLMLESLKSEVSSLRLTRSPEPSAKVQSRLLMKRVVHALIIVLDAHRGRDGGGDCRDSDGMVQELASRVCRPGSEPVPERPDLDSSGSAGTCSSASRWKTSRSR